jgi:HSP20 family protein
MSAQIAVQPAKASVPVRKSATDDVFDQIEETYNAIARRAFELFDNRGRWFGNDLEDWFRAESELLQPVNLEITETDDNFTVRAEVPGFSIKELTIDVEPHLLTITGRHEAQEESKKGKTIYSERSGKQVMRVVNLPADIDTSKATATLKDGVLNLELPKAAHAKAVRVEPKGA